MPDDDKARRTLTLAVDPAMRANELNLKSVELAFDSDSPLAQVSPFLQSAEVIVADLYNLNPHVMYIVGLCHGLSRCPILISPVPNQLPFNLQSLRFLEFVHTNAGLSNLRQGLTRAIRVFLASARAGEKR